MSAELPVWWDISDVAYFTHFVFIEKKMVQQNSPPPIRNEANKTHPAKGLLFHPRLLEK